MKINLFTSTPDWVKRVLLISIAFACCWTAGGTFVTRYYKIKKQQEYPIVVYRGDIELKLQESKSLLVDEVDAYIKKIAPTSNLNARILVELCDEYDIDIKFALAQGQIESHYATKGLARKTNSVFNVLAYDGKSFGEICKKGKYSHPDHSIEPYLKLICNDYLVDGKTEYDLLDNYVNKDGNRYASAKDYERKMKSTFNMISDSTLIDELYSEYKHYKILTGA